MRSVTSIGAERKAERGRLQPPPLACFLSFLCRPKAAQRAPTDRLKLQSRLQADEAAASAKTASTAFWAREIASACFSSLKVSRIF